MQNNHAKFTFFYLLSLVALIITAIASGMIIFQIINKAIVDLLNEYRQQFSSEALKAAISMLIIGAPIYYLTARQIMRNLRSGNLIGDSDIRKWLSYLIIFASSVVMIVWLIMTVNTLLDGELTAKFALKMFAVLLIAGSIFVFYIYDIKRRIVTKKDVVVQIFVWVSLAFVIAVFVASLFFLESPSATRDRKIDERVLNDFNQIENNIQRYYVSYAKLPANLDDVRGEYFVQEELLRNSVSLEPYEYRIMSGVDYELCATFLHANVDDENMKNNIYTGNNNLHETGYQCLKRKVYSDSVDKMNRGEIPVVPEGAPID